MNLSLAASDHPSEASRRFRFGVVTARPKEFAAMIAMLDDSRPRSVPDDPNDYVIGSVRAANGSGVHHVVVTLLKKPGNNSAAAATTNLLRSFPGVEDVLMVGIAGGCPHPSQPDKHVRLGDIVVSDHYGVLQYDNIKLADGVIEIRDTSSPPSAALLGKVNLLEAGRVSRDYPWERYIPRTRTLEGAP